MNNQSKIKLILYIEGLAALCILSIVLWEKWSPKYYEEIISPVSQPNSVLTVIKIIDGDTFLLSDGREIRLLAVDTPETGEPYSDSAKAFAESLLVGKIVTLRFENQQEDNYGRVLAYLYIDSLLYNELILKAGMAGLYLFIGNTSLASRLIAAQNKARKGRRGIWSLPTPEREDYYISAAASYRFHRPLCTAIKNINLKKARRIATRDNALDIGLSPCRQCRP